MPKKAKPLSALEVQRLAKPGYWTVGTVPGLGLQVLPSGARTWVLRAVVGARRRHMGLGGYPAVTLANAIAAARAARERIMAGIDPIAEREAAASALRAAQSKVFTFKQAAVAYMAAHESGWRNPKHAQQWANTLTTYAYPTIGELDVGDIALPHILSILEPIWSTKTETASRVRNRIELVLDWATARGYRQGLNPARWRGHLDKLLPRPSKVSKRKHHTAVALADAGAFVQRLRMESGIAARALEFLILTAARSGEVRGAQWGEIDEAAAIWTIPGTRMKAGRDHRIPLSDAALEVLQGLPRSKDERFVFSSPGGGGYSDMALAAVMRRMNMAAVPHGFRSTFRDWASERTTYPHEVAEMALAHTIQNKAEAAYRRGELAPENRTAR